MQKDTFRDLVIKLVRSIPKGKVMSYGQIANLCGSPMASRIVGGIAHRGSPSVPWQRVVHKDGSLATGYYGGIEGHRTDLIKEGVDIGEDLKVNMKVNQWKPED